MILKVQAHVKIYVHKENLKDPFLSLDLKMSYSPLDLAVNIQKPLTGLYIQNN